MLRPLSLRDPMLRALMAALFACGTLPVALAQPVYKYQLPDGRIVYSSEAVPNGKLIGTVRPAPAPQPVDADKQAKMKRDREAAAQAGKRRADRLEAANAEVIAATQALEEAKARQAAGVEPEEGERSGTVRPGLSRPNSAYLERQTQLQEDVDAAQKRLDEAYKARNEAR